MSTTLLVAIALLLGTAIGVVVSQVVVTVAKRRAEHREMTNRKPPKIAVEVFDRLEHPAVILDTSLTTVYANKTARTSEMLDLEALFTNQKFMRLMRSVMETGKSFTHVPVDPDNAMVTAESVAKFSETFKIQAFRLKKRFVAVLLVDLAAERRLNAIRRDFIANVSHELKTPVAAIGLLSEAITEAADDPETVTNFAQSLQQESRRLNNIVKDIINLSQAQSELSTTDLEPVALRSLITQEVKAHENYAAQRNVQLVLTDNLTAGAELYTLGRQNALGVAIANVLSNAIRYSPEGEKVGIGLRVQDDFLDLAIADNGPGIAAKHQERVFERFYRVNAARSRDEGGTGLGLAITRHTLRAHGGDVSLWSKPGTGSTFTLRFPLVSKPEFTELVDTAAKEQQ